MHDLPTPKPFVYFANAPIPLAGIIKIPPPRPADLPYDKLECSDEDRMLIAELITMLGENGKIALLFKQGYAKALGARVEHVHPLKFLGVVFTNPSLKGHMVSVFDDYFKRNGFMDGLGANLTREQEKGRLQQYIPDFASEIDIPVETIRPYIQTSDWEGLVKFLIERP